MNTLKLAAVAMILAGVLALAYGSFSFTKATHEATLGPLTMSVQEKQTVNVPVWAGVAAIAIGAALLVFGGKRG
jgi:hypothetical protein